MKITFEDASLGAIETGAFAPLRQCMLDNPNHGSFEILLRPRVYYAVKNLLPNGDFDAWITRERTWRTDEFSPSVTLNNAERFLGSLWQDLAQRLVRKMEGLKRHVDIGTNGSVICFPGGHRLSVLVSYSDASISGVAHLRPLTATKEPEGMLELERLLDNLAPAEISRLKKALVSVDKLVYYRSTLIHVNRQMEDVFGPTIDTVILAEELRHDIISRGRSGISVLEVGPGSGLISAQAILMDNVDRLVSIELNGPSAICTLKNLLINDLTPASSFKSISVRAERFSQDDICEKFDYIVCNPPYIPEVEALEKWRASGYGAAISGLELYGSLFGCLAKLLNEGGRLLMMASSVSLDLVKPMLLDGYVLSELSRSEQRRVPLDLDLLWDRPDWQKFLLERGAIDVGDGGKMYHTLVPIWVDREA